MTWEDVAQALREARHVQRVAERHANDMAEFLSGRLRHVNVSTLRELKAELRRFDSRTGGWMP